MMAVMKLKYKLRAIQMTVPMIALTTTATMLMALQKKKRPRCSKMQAISCSRVLSSLRVRRKPPHSSRNSDQQALPT